MSSVLAAVWTGHGGRELASSDPSFQHLSTPVDWGGTGSRTHTLYSGFRKKLLAEDADLGDALAAGDRGEGRDADERAGVGGMDGLDHLAEGVRDRRHELARGDLATERRVQV